MRNRNYPPRRSSNSTRAPNRDFSGMRNQRNKQVMHPSLKAALIIFIPLALLPILNAFVFKTYAIYLYPVQLILYLFSGILAAKFFADSLHHTKPKNLRDSFIKHGAIAGLTLGIISLIFTIIFSIVLKLTSYGISWFGNLTLVICVPADVIIAMFIGALGAKIYEGLWR